MIFFHRDTAVGRAITLLLVLVACSSSSVEFTEADDNHALQRGNGGASVGKMKTGSTRASVGIGTSTIYGEGFSTESNTSGMLPLPSLLEEEEENERRLKKSRNQKGTTKKNSKKYDASQSKKKKEKKNKAKKTDSPAPSSHPSLAPSPYPSVAPSLSTQPSEQPSGSTVAPSISEQPSEQPSNSPSVSMHPSGTPSISEQPSGAPSLSKQPSSVPSISLQPSSSPVKVCPPPTQIKIVSAQTTSVLNDDSSRFGPSYAFDCNEDTFWASKKGVSTEEYIILDFGSAQSYQSMNVKGKLTQQTFGVFWSVDSSNDLTTWNNLLFGGFSLNRVYSTVGTSRYVRIKFVEGMGNFLGVELYEVIFGTQPVAR